MRNTIACMMIVGAALVGPASAQNEGHDRAPRGDVTVPVPVPPGERHDMDDRSDKGCESRTVTKENDKGVFEMMMAKENASQRREWMETYGNLVDADIS